LVGGGVGCLVICYGWLVDWLRRFGKDSSLRFVRIGPFRNAYFVECMGSRFETVHYLTLHWSNHVSFKKDRGLGAVSVKHKIVSYTSRAVL
jgi:hypothetical protein